MQFFSKSPTDRIVIPGAPLELNEHGEIAWGCCGWNKPESKACWNCGRPRRKAYIVPTEREFAEACNRAQDANARTASPMMLRLGQQSRRTIPASPGRLACGSQPRR